MTSLLIRYYNYIIKEMSKVGPINQFSKFDTTKAWIVFSLGLPLFLIYAAALVLTSYNLHAVKGRFHTKVLLRT